MPIAGDTYDPATDTDDYTKFDQDSPTYNYALNIPNGEITKAGSAAAAEALPVGYVTRVLKISPYTQQVASPSYDQVWNDRATLTYIGG